MRASDQPRSWAASTALACVFLLNTFGVPLRKTFAQKKSPTRGRGRGMGLQDAGLRSSSHLFFTRQQSYRKVLRSSFFLSRHVAPRTTREKKVHLLSSFRRFAPVLHIPYRHSRAFDWLPIAAVSSPQVPPRGTATVPPVAATMRARHARTDPPPYTRRASRRFFCTFARPRLSYPARRRLNHPPSDSASVVSYLPSLPHLPNLVASQVRGLGASPLRRMPPACPFLGAGRALRLLRTLSGRVQCVA